MKYLSNVRKLFFFLTFMLFVIGFQSHIEASDFYLGEYSDGNTAYLMTGSIKESSGYDGGDRYDCYVKIVIPNADDYETTHYSISYNQVLSMQRDGEYLYTLRTMYDFFTTHPVEKNLVSYINKHYRVPYGKPI
ncbi:hypothetical protein [Anaerovibrio lipolyticus]|uniref:hypothetical protein n=1 Tax=Anaerovibrio lipolyticus TaxID=82374 RepID=UPI00048A42BC|nr:hypothetical protein [Anaerovibrio lipolyticus]